KSFQPNHYHGRSVFTDFCPHPPLIGVAIVLALLISVLSQSHIVIFPNAMLPMELHELALIWLAMGFIPMLIASILFHRVFEISKSNHKKRNTILTYIPTGICLLCVVVWFLLPISI
ncbi:MAG: hypothetical protein NC337_02175, partial [Roseburia sp.]|nr:hypothetical protein [Roseburia sp.]